MHNLKRELSGIEPKSGLPFPEEDTEVLVRTHRAKRGTKDRELNNVDITDIVSLYNTKIASARENIEELKARIESDTEGKISASTLEETLENYRGNID